MVNNSISIGLSALRAAQTGLEVASNNIANANTPGYHRQQLVLSDRNPLDIDGVSVGTGVNIERVRRLRDVVVEHALTRNTFTQADLDAQLAVLREIETLFTHGEGSLHDHLQGFLTGLQQLSSRPDDTVLREIVINSGNRFALELQSSVERLDRIQADIDQQIDEAVREVNRLSEEIGELNRLIAEQTGRGLQPNDLLDRREQLADQLAQWVDASLDEPTPGDTVVRFGSGAVLIGQTTPVLTIAQEDGQVVLRREGNSQPLQLGGGRLAGLLTARNQLLSEFRTDLDQLAVATMTAFDSVHTGGLGGGGGFELLTGTRSVEVVNASLASQLTAFPLEAGTLSVTVTDTASGEQFLTTIAIDPAVDSLADLATRLSGIDHLQAVVNPDTGELSLLAENGYTFDFTGRPQTNPDVASITGTTRPTVSGQYSGDDNTDLTFTIVGSGTVGVTAGLRAEVRNSAGVLIADLDIGENYEPGSPLDVDGLRIEFDSGTLNAGDTFSVAAVADSDTAGILTSLGLNTFFQGTSATDIQVNSALLENADRFALSQSGQPGDGGNLLRFVRAAESVIVDDAPGLQAFLNETTAVIGSRVAEAESVLAGLSAVGEQLTLERDSVSGVDPNEELLQILQFQRAFQSASRFISSINTALDEVLNLAR